MKSIRYIFLILLFIPIISISAITKEPSLNGKINYLQKKPIQEVKKTTNNIEDLYIKYSVTNGYSRSSSNLIIDQKGNVFLETTNSKNNKNTKNIKLNSKEFTNLRSILNNAKMFSLNDSYKCEKFCSTDTNNISIDFYYYEKIKTINIVNPIKLPESLQKVLNTLNSLQKRTSYAK